MKDNSKYVAIVLAILAIIVVIVSLITSGDKESRNSNPTIVTNASNFYTVNSCLYRVITYLSNKDKDSLNLVVSEDYKKENKVLTKDILSIFPEVDSDSTFVSEKMYYEIISENINKYYVKGHVEDNIIMDDAPLKPEVYDSIYFIVYLNSSDKIFSVEPYDGEIFREGGSNEK